MGAFLTALVLLLRRRRYLAIWATGLVTMAVFISLTFLPSSPIERLNLLVFDAYQRLKPREAGPSTVAVVDIDDESIRRLGQWPWSRTVLALVIDRLTEYGAASIGLDIILSEPDRTSPALAVAQLEAKGFHVSYEGEQAELDHDLLLSKTFARSPVVAGLVLAESATTPAPPPKAGFAFGGDDPASYLPAFPGSVRNLEILDAAAPGIGVFSFPPAADGVVRQIPMLSRYDTSFYPTLSIESLRVAQGASTFIVRSTGATGELDTGNPGMTALKVGEFEVPTGADGKIWVYYSATPAQTVIPVHQLLAPDPDPQLREAVAGHVVLVGTSAIGLRDLVSTPMMSGLPGVMVHAEIADQIVAGQFITRPDWAVGLEVVAAIGLSLLLLGFLPWMSTLGAALAAALGFSLCLLYGWWAFAVHDLLISPILPALTGLLAYGTASGTKLVLSESERRYIRQAFDKYLSPAMVNRLMDNPENLVLGGEDRELTILFCDIRSFTSISETMNATELTVFLNDFLTPMTDVLMMNGATIDKYMGDGIMAFWNAPLDVPDHRRKAAASVLAMQKTLEEFNASLQRPVRVGIGINTGVCCVGNLGSRQHFSYSAIGDPVNVASRIEGLTKQYGVSNLLSEGTARGAEGMAFLEIDRVAVVGRGEATSVFMLLGDEAVAGRESFRELKRLHDRFLADYRARRFGEAEASLAQLAAEAPAELESVYAEYRHRLRSFEENPPPADWDGTFRAEHK